MTGKTPQRWNAVSGQTGAAVDFRANPDGTTIPLDFDPWESAFFVFSHEPVPARTAPVKLTAPMPAPMPIMGEWGMKLEGYGFETWETNINTLASWTDAERTRHFSGTGRYAIEFELPASLLVNGARMTLDLGKVGNLAEVELNGQAVGVAWTAPYRLDITRAARAGKNKLVVLVTNTLINYVTGLKKPPEVPAELQPRLGKANPAIYEQSKLASREMSETDLPPSGLIGPVTISSKEAFLGQSHGIR